MSTLSSTLKSSSVPGAGSSKIITITATPDAASRTITLTEATHGITAIDGILGCTITGGADVAFGSVTASYSGLVLTSLASPLSSILPYCMVLIFFIGTIALPSLNILI